MYCINSFVVLHVYRKCGFVNDIHADCISKQYSVSGWNCTII